MDKSLTKEISSARRGDFFAIGNILPDPDTILLRNAHGMGVYRELSNDAHVRSCVTSRKAGTLAKGWRLEKRKASDKNFDLVQKALARLDLDAIINQILNAPLFGYQPMEVVWEVEQGIVLPAKVEAKPQEWFVFDRDGRLRLLSKANLFEGELLPERKFLCPRHNATYINPYGERILASIFWAVTFKKGGLKFWVSFVEKYGMPWAIGKLNRQTIEEEAQMLKEALENMVQDGVAVIDNNCDIQLTESSSKTASAEVYRELVEFNNDEISKAILGQTLTTQVGSTGSYAAGKVHLSVREDIIQSDIRIVQNAINELIKWVLELSGEAFSAADGSMPVFVIYDKNAINLELAQRDEILSRSGVRFSREYFEKTYSLSDSDICSA